MSTDLESLQALRIRTLAETVAVQDRTLAKYAEALTASQEVVAVQDEALEDSLRSLRSCQEIHAIQRETIQAVNKRADLWKDLVTKLVPKRYEVIGWLVGAMCGIVCLALVVRGVHVAALPLLISFCFTAATSAVHLVRTRKN